MRLPGVWLLLLAMCGRELRAAKTSWTHWGGNLENQRYADICVDGVTLKTAMKPQWTTTTQGNAYCPPAVCGGFLYTVDQAGYAYKFSTAKGGAPVWKVLLKDLGVPLKPPFRAVTARATPILDDTCKTVYIFTQRARGGWLIALQASTGKKVYVKKVGLHDLTAFTQSGTFYKGSLYIGAASGTEGSLTEPTFRGHLQRISAVDGKVLWQTFTCPPNWYGCAIWGSSPVIDVARSQVCVGTGNNYKIPKDKLQCKLNAGLDRVAQLKCSPANNYVDALVCFDLKSGAVKWARPMNGLDVWLPETRELGVDHDFAQAPILVKGINKGKDLLIGTPKSAQPIAVDPSNGKIVWGPLPAETRAYAMFGSCSNGPTYCYGLYWYAKTQGAVICIHSATGRQRWRWFISNEEGVLGPMTCTNNVVFAPRMDTAGSLMAFDINTGKVLASFKTGATIFGGPTIVKNVAYFANGYAANGGVFGNKLYAIALPLKPTC